jgi:hypothetical protein
VSNDRRPEVPESNFKLPESVDVDAIAEDAMQAGFKVICDRLSEATDGAHTWGDVDPLESRRIDLEFRGWVRMMAENNEAIQRLNAPRRTLTISFDVTGLKPEEIDALAGEATVQGERSDDHPDVSVFPAKICEEF